MFPSKISTGCIRPLLFLSIRSFMEPQADNVIFMFKSVRSKVFNISYAHVKSKIFSNVKLFFCKIYSVSNPPDIIFLYSKYFQSEKFFASSLLGSKFFFAWLYVRLCDSILCVFIKFTDFFIM